MRPAINATTGLVIRVLENHRRTSLPRHPRVLEDVPFDEDAPTDLQLEVVFHGIDTLPCVWAEAVVEPNLHVGWREICRITTDEDVLPGTFAVVVDPLHRTRRIASPEGLRLGSAAVANGRDVAVHYKRIGGMHGNPAPDIQRADIAIDVASIDANVRWEVGAVRQPGTKVQESTLLGRSRGKLQPDNTVVRCVRSPGCRRENRRIGRSGPKPEHTRRIRRGHPLAGVFRERAVVDGLGNDIAVPCPCSGREGPVAINVSRNDNDRVILACAIRQRRGQLRRIGNAVRRS